VAVEILELPEFREEFLGNHLLKGRHEAPTMVSGSFTVYRRAPRRQVVRDDFSRTPIGPL
jgi:hypothetical protein